MEFPKGDVCRKLANPIMVGTKTFWKDGTTMINTARLCQKMGGLKSRLLFSMTKLHWKITPIARRGERDRNEKSWVLKLNQEVAQGPMNQRPDFVEAKRELKRLHGEDVKEISEGNTPIHLVQRSRQRRGQQFEGL